MASGNHGTHTSGRNSSNGTHSAGSSMEDKTSMLSPLLNNGSARPTSTNGEAPILNPSKKQKTSDAKATTSYDVSATSTTTTTTTRAPATTVTNTKTPIIATRALTTTTKTKAAISTTPTTNASQHIHTAAAPKQGRMTAASFFEEEVVFLDEVRGTKRKHESMEASTSPPTVLLPSTTSPVVASYNTDPKILPEKIVLLIDRQDAYLKSFYYPNVLHIYENKLNFRNAFSMIIKSENIFKNTLFVMMCGTMSALKQEINKECHLFLCKEPLYNYSMQDFKAPSLQEHLINEAKALRKKIVAMDNCDIIFSGMLPVRVDRAEAYEAERHYSQTGHQVRVNSSRCEGLYGRLCAGLKEFNKWAREDSESLGFPNWSLVDAYTAAVSSAPEHSKQHCTDLTEDCNRSSNDSRGKDFTADSSSYQHSEDAMENMKSIPLSDTCNVSQDNRTCSRNSPRFTGYSGNPTESYSSPSESITSCQPFTHPTEANGVTLAMECMLERRLALKTKVRETFLRVKKVTRTAKPPALPRADVNEDSEVVLPKLKIHQAAAPQTNGDVGVVVVGDAKHKNILSNLVEPFLSCKKVTLITLQKLSPDDMTDIVSNYYSQVPWNTNTVWMLCFDILDFVDFYVYPKCLNLQCKSCLPSFSVKRDDWHGKVESKIEEVINTVNEFKSKLDSGILSNALLLIVPPMQLALLNGEAFRDHRKLHSVAEKHNLVICDKVTYDLTRTFYSHLFGAWPNFGELIEGIFQKPISNYIIQCKNSCLYDGSLPNVGNIGMRWMEMMEEVINIALKKYLEVFSGVNLSAHLKFLPFISLSESACSMGRMLSINLPKMPDEGDRLFRHVVVVGNQIPAELDNLCHQLSIHVMPQRVTFDEAGKLLIQKYQKHWPKGTLWVILSDVLHTAKLQNLKMCLNHNCREIIQAYEWKLPRFAKKTKWKASSEAKINQVISKAKKFSESLSDNLGDGSAVFLPPVTPVFLLHTNEQWKHERLHKWYDQSKKAVPVFVGKKSLKNIYKDLKEAWLEMLKSYLEKYPVPMKILELYQQGKEDWITTLGNFLVHFANAKKDTDDAVFSDAEFSSGEETVMGEEEEDTGDLANPAYHQEPSTVDFSTPSVSHTYRAAPVLEPAPSLSHHPIPPTSVSVFPPYPMIAVRQDLRDEQDTTTSNSGSSMERTHWTITSETSVDIPGTVEKDHPKRPKRTLLETPVNFPRTLGSTPRKRPKRTLLKTPVNSQKIPVTLSKAHQKTALEAQVNVSIEQHQDGNEGMKARVAQGPLQQPVVEKDHLTSNTKKGQLTLKAVGGRLTPKAEEIQLTPKTDRGKLDPGTEEGRTGQVTPQAFRVGKTEVVARVEESHVSHRKKVDQQANGTQENEFTIKMEKNLESQRKEKGQIPRIEEDQVVVQSEDATSSKEDHVTVERSQNLKRRLTLTEDIDGEMSDDESNGQWIILSETEEDHGDTSEEEDSSYAEKKDCPKDSSKEKDQDTMSVEREALNYHSKNTVTTVQTAAERQSLVPKAELIKNTTVSETLVKSHSTVSEAKNLQSKDKENNTASTVVKHTKDNSITSSALDKASKDANTASTITHTKDSSTTPPVSEHSESNSMEPSAKNKLKKNCTTAAVDKQNKNSNALVNENCNTTSLIVGKHSRKSSTVSALVNHKKNCNTSPAAEQHKENSNTSSSAGEKCKKSDTPALPAVDKQSKNNNTAPAVVDKDENSDTASPAKDNHCKKKNTAPALNDSTNTAQPALGKHSKKNNIDPVLYIHSKSRNTAPSTADKNKDSGTLLSILDRHSKNSSAAPSSVDKHSKRSNTAPSILCKDKNSDKASPTAEKDSKNSNTAPSTADEHSKTAPITPDKNSKNINTVLSAENKHRNSNTASPTPDKHTKNSNLLPTQPDSTNTNPLAVGKHSNKSNIAAVQDRNSKNSTTATPTQGKHSKDSNTALSAADKNKNSNTALSAVGINKNSSTATPTPDGHSESSDTALSAVDRNKNSITAMPLRDSHIKNSSTAPAMPNEKSKNSTTAPATPNEKSKNSNTAPATPNEKSKNSNTAPAMPNEKSKNSNTAPARLDKHRRDSSTASATQDSKSSTAPATQDKHSINSNTAPATQDKHKRNSSTASATQGKHRKNSNTAPGTPDINKNSNTAPATPDNSNTVATSQDKHKNSNTAPTAQDKHGGNSKTAPATQDKHRRNSNTAPATPDDNNKTSNTAPASQDKHRKNSNTALVTQDKHRRNSSTASVTPNKNSKNNTAPATPDNSKNSNTAPAAQDKHSKESNTTPAMQDKHSKNSNTAPATQDKHSKNSNTVPATQDKHSKNSNTVPATPDKHSKNSNTGPATQDKHRRNISTAPATPDNSKNSNTISATQDERSNTATPSQDKHSKNRNTAPAAPDGHCKNSSVAPSPVRGNKSNSIASSTVDTHSQNSTIAPPAPDGYSKNSSTAPSIVDIHRKNSNTAPSTVNKIKNSDTILLTPEKQSSNSNTALSTLDKQKDRNTLNRNMNSGTALSIPDKHSKDSNTALSVVDNKSSDTDTPIPDKRSKKGNTAPSTVRKYKDTNILLPPTDKQSSSCNTVSPTLHKHKNKNAAPSSVRRSINSNTAPPALDNHSNTIWEPSMDRNPDTTQFPCHAKSYNNHNKDENCEVSTKQGITLDQQEAEEDLPDLETLSNTDSVETIILSSSELEQESLDHYAKECQPMTGKAILQMGSELYSNNLDSPNENHCVESELPQNDFVRDENLWGCDDIEETDSVVSSSPSCGTSWGGTHLPRRKRKLLYSGASPLLNSSSACSSFDSDPMEVCFSELLEDLRTTFQVLWHTYLLTPEAHPNFEEKLEEFRKHYKKSNGGQLEYDPEHNEKAWRVFWKDWVKKHLHQEKQKSKQMLFENFRPMVKESQRTCSAHWENQPKQMKMDEGSKESHMLQGDRTSTDRWLPPSATERVEKSWSLPQSPPKVNQKSLCASMNMTYPLPSDDDQVEFKSSSVSPNTSKQSADSINLEKPRSLSLSLKGKTSTSDISAMSHCQWMISNISTPASDREGASYSLPVHTDAKERAEKRVCLILRCFKMLSEFGVTLGTLAPALVPIIKAVLDGGVQSDKPLDILSDPDNVLVMKMCSEKLQWMGEKAKGVRKKKLLQCSSDINELLENISVSVMSLEMIEGLHIPTIAKLTAQKDMPSVLEFVKDALAMRNVHNPPKSLVNKLFLAVSTYHSIMATQSSPMLAVTTSPGTR